MNSIELTHKTFNKQVKKMILDKFNKIKSFKRVSNNEFRLMSENNETIGFWAKGNWSRDEFGSKITILSQYKDV